MFQRGKDAPVSVYGFLVAVPIEDGSITSEAVAIRLADSVAFMEGTGPVDVEQLGKIDLYSEQQPDSLEVNNDQAKDQER